MKIKGTLGFGAILLLIMMISCGSDETAYPRPRGFYRIDFPEKKYERTSEALPFSFERPIYSNLQGTQTDGAQFQTNVQFGWYNATLYCSYKQDTNLVEHVSFAKKMAYEHQRVARSIEEVPFLNKEENVYGLMYAIDGDQVASNYSFYLMDSVDRFFRGSFYFNETPNADSLQPVLDFLKEDLDHIIQSFRWEAEN
jgi:gliding motility-associated lipoprotein GldD